MKKLKKGSLKIKDEGELANNKKAAPPPEKEHEVEVYIPKKKKSKKQEVAQLEFNDQKKQSPNFNLVPGELEQDDGKNEEKATHDNPKNADSRSPLLLQKSTKKRKNVDDEDHVSENYDANDKGNEDADDFQQKKKKKAKPEAIVAKFEEKFAKDFKLSQIPKGQTFSSCIGWSPFEEKGDGFGANKSTLRKLQKELGKAAGEVGRKALTLKKALAVVSPILQSHSLRCGEQKAEKKSDANEKLRQTMFVREFFLPKGAKIVVIGRGADKSVAFCEVAEEECGIELYSGKARAGQGGPGNEGGGSFRCYKYCLTLKVINVLNKKDFFDHGEKITMSTSCHVNSETMRKKILGAYAGTVAKTNREEVNKAKKVMKKDDSIEEVEAPQVKKRKIQQKHDTALPAAGGDDEDAGVDGGGHTRTKKGNKNQKEAKSYTTSCKKSFVTTGILANPFGVAITGKGSQGGLNLVKKQGGAVESVEGKKKSAEGNKVAAPTSSSLPKHQAIVANEKLPVAELRAASSVPASKGPSYTPGQKLFGRHEPSEDFKNCEFVRELPAEMKRHKKMNKNSATEDETTTQQEKNRRILVRWEHDNAEEVLAGDNVVIRQKKKRLWGYFQPEEKWKPCDHFGMVTEEDGAQRVRVKWKHDDSVSVLATDCVKPRTGDKNEMPPEEKKELVLPR
ncbi:unnamed protein product [Amoebophrya sp. A120]|nr:unnamed protein product [Amoebophrya sp. A120]|eukprot:GSA120T00024396001.1